MPNHPCINIDGVKFRMHKNRGEIYYSEKFEKRFIKVLNNLIRFAGNELRQDLLEDIEYSEDGLTAKEAFFAYTINGRLFATRETEDLILLLKADTGLKREKKKNKCI